MWSAHKCSAEAKDHNISVPTSEDDEELKLLRKLIKGKKKKANKKTKGETASVSHFNDTDVQFNVCDLNTSMDITSNISKNNKSHSSLLHDTKKKKKKKTVEVVTCESTVVPKIKTNNKEQKLCNKIHKDNFESNVEKCISTTNRETNQNKMYKSSEQQKIIDDFNQDATCTNVLDISDYEELTSFLKSLEKKKKKKKGNKVVTQVENMSPKKLIKNKKQTTSDVNHEEYDVKNKIVADAVKKTNDKQLNSCNIDSKMSQTSLSSLKKHNVKDHVKIKGNDTVGVTSQNSIDLEYSLILSEMKKRKKKSKKKTIQVDTTSSKKITNPIPCHQKHNVVLPDIPTTNIRKQKLDNDNKMYQNVGTDIDTVTSKSLENDAINKLILKEVNKRKTKSNKTETPINVVSPKKVVK